MTSKHTPTEPVDETWLAHLREVTTGVTPPTPADPHSMSRAAIRRTRTRRAVLVTGGGVTAAAAVAVTAFALGGPMTAGGLLPGGSTSAPVTASASANPAQEEMRATAEELRAKALEEAAAEAPAGWHVHELEGLVYALPPEIVTSGPVQDEPGETSDMWHGAEDPDAPPFIRIAYVTPDYEFYDTKAGGLTQTPGREATPFELSGATVATVEDGSSEKLREIMAMPAGDGAPEPVRILVHRADGPGRYIVTMTLPEGNAELVEKFLDSLTLS